MSIDKVLSEEEAYEIAGTIGKKSEDRFFQAFEEQGWEKPKWYKSIRRATGLEDNDGYDFFIDTDTGEMGIQVKSSWKYVGKYHRRHPNSKASVIVVHAESDFDRIRRLTLDKLERQRSKVRILKTGAWSIPTKTFD